jgi:pimeloyl-ACP methyl ester carboxylesterase
MQIPKSVKTMFSFLATLFIAYVLFCVAVFFFQRHMIYFPRPEVGVPGVAHIFLDTGKVRVKVWTLNPGRREAVLYFGGNAENVADNIDDFRSIFAGRTVYLVNYRGYGGSSGTPSEEGLYSDALLAYDYFAKKHTDVSVMGRSVGTGVATYVASRRTVKKLVLVTPFDSLEHVARTHYPFLPVGLILREQYDSAGRGAKINADTLIVASRDDEIVPIALSKHLGDTLIHAPLKFAELSEVGHNTIHLHPAYRKIIADFMAR